MTNKQKHLDLKCRYIIEHSLDSSMSFKAISRELGKDCTTISKEVRNHLIFKKSGSYGRPFNDCASRFDCNFSNICTNCTNRSGRPCKFCGKCPSFCTSYRKEYCTRLSKPPYVCNGCKDRNSCTLEKRLYDAVSAQKEYELTRSESRSGFAISEEELARLDGLVSPLLLKGQSIHHICQTHSDSIMLCEKTVYTYVDNNLLTARNIDMPRKVRLRPRKQKSVPFKADKSCRIGRTYQDYLKYLELHPDIFQEFFPVLLADNGSEFSNPSRIEFDKQENLRCHMFYCNPSAPYQKGAAENNHELIRRVIPKGKDFSLYSQEQISLMMSHINSYLRKNLGNKSPYETFAFQYGEDILKKLGLRKISPAEIILSPELLK